MELMDNIRTLSDLPGVSGWEDAVREEILAQIKGYCEVSVDPLGNILAVKKGTRPAKNRVLLSAHMDEVGFVVTHIEDSGYLRFAAVGGIDKRVILGRPVEIGKDRLFGVIGAKALHQQTAKEQEEAVAVDKLLIDIGAKNKTEAEAVVRPGDRAVFYSVCQKLGQDKIMGRALDDRAGCALLISLIQAELPCDCLFSFTVQEETGCTGAVTVGYSLRPEYAVAVETTTASDIPGTEPHKVVCSLGKGPVVSFMDRGTIYDHDLYDLALRTAAEHGIPCQSKEGVYGGNESRSLQTARQGVRTLAVSLPCRYLHTACNVLHREDIAHTRSLLEHLIGVLGQR